MRMVILLSPMILMAGSLGSAEEKRLDSLGDPLPKDAVQRLGTLRMKTSLRDLCYLPDGRAVSLAGSYVYVWDLAKGKVQERLKVSDGRVMSVVCRPGPFIRKS